MKYSYMYIYAYSDCDEKACLCTKLLQIKRKTELNKFGTVYIYFSWNVLNTLF